jgi:hypothetical protein
LSSLGIDLQSGAALPAPTLAALGAQLRRKQTPMVPVQKLGIPDDMPPAALDKTGWCVVWADDVGTEVRAALEPLLALRRGESGAYFKELDWTKTDVSARAWLRSNLAGITVDPGKVPYYVLLVGSPSRIPFARQCELAGMGYAVGRLDFGEVTAQYRTYADGVVAAASRHAPRQIAFWATRQDAATIASHDHFAKHLAYGERDATEAWHAPAAASHGFSTLARLDGDAKKAELLSLWQSAPPLWVTASHGIGVAATRANAAATQGALLTQDWALGTPTEDQLLRAADVTCAANLQGSIGLLMACFGAGTPAADDFPWTSPQDRSQAAAYFSGTPFVAALPQRLLSLESGPAQGIVAHVDRAWSLSFAPDVAGDRNGAFRSLLSRLMGQARLGHAMGALAARHAELSVPLTAALASAQSDDAELGALWLEQRDARNYLVLGDPACRLELAANQPSA